MSIRPFARNHRCRRHPRLALHAGRTSWASFVLLLIWFLPVVTLAAGGDVSEEGDALDEMNPTTLLSSISVLSHPTRRRRKPAGTPADRVSSAFVEHYRCPEEFAPFTRRVPLSDRQGFFNFGPEIVCYGRCSAVALPASRAQLASYDAFADITNCGIELELPFNPSEVVENLRYERYATATIGARMSALRRAYYLARPFLGVGIRKHLQRGYLRGWRDISFPRWPVDATVETLFENLLGLILKTQVPERIPFVWFWPDGYQSCVMMTHDVETARGLDFCSQLMDMDDEHGLKSSFQLVPEGRYPTSKCAIDAIRSRGFEVNIHDFNHDGQLFNERGMFLERCARINQYAREYGADGFRSAILYRNAEWLSELRFQYDMSSPASGRLEAQQGGCCSVLPFYIGSTLELPLTTIQDYSLFHILNDYSIDVWKGQIAAIRGHNGLVSFIIHPDYIDNPRGRETYLSLLAHLRRFQSAGDAWFALPNEINAWWRNRSEMTLVHRGNGWEIDGPGKERARIAYATLDGDRLVYDC